MLLKPRTFLALALSILPITLQAAFFGAPSAFRLRVVPQLKATEMALRSAALAVPVAPFLPTATSTPPPALSPTPTLSATASITPSATDTSSCTPSPSPTQTFSPTPTSTLTSTFTSTATFTPTSTPFLATLGEVVGQPALTIVASSAGSADPVAFAGPVPAGANNNDMIMSGEADEEGDQSILEFDVPPGKTGFRFKFYLTTIDDATRVEVYRAGSLVYACNVCPYAGEWQGVWQGTPLPVSPGDALKIRFIRSPGNPPLPGAYAFFDDFVFTP